MSSQRQLRPYISTELAISGSYKSIDKQYSPLRFGDVEGIPSTWRQWQFKNATQTRAAELVYLRRSSVSWGEVCGAELQLLQLLLLCGA